MLIFKRTKLFQRVPSLAFSENPIAATFWTLDTVTWQDMCPWEAQTDLWDFFMEAGLKLHCSMLNQLTSRYQYTSVHCVTVHRMMKLIAFSLNRTWFLLYLFHSWIIFRCNVWLFRADFLTYLSHLFLVVNSSVNIVIYCWKDKKFHRCAEWWHN